MTPAFALTTLLAGSAGACLGSFTATAALRSAGDERFVLGRSRCDSCRRPLGWLDTLPVLSFLQARGSCTTCGARIDRLHIVGEIAGAAIILTAFAVATPVRAVLLAPLGLILLSQGIIDHRTRRLPDLLTLAVAVLGCVLAAQRSPIALWTGVAGAAGSFVLLEIVRRVFLQVRGKAGLGFGDVKLIAALALWLGAATPWAVAAAALVGLGVMAATRPADGRIAFGPSIALAAWIIGMFEEALRWPTLV